MQKVEYLNSPAGGGKTHSLIKKAAKLAWNGNPVLFCQPTVELIEQTAANMKNDHQDMIVETIHKVNSPTPVKDIVKALFAESPDEYVLLITQSALERIPSDFDRSQWHLIVDEIPNVTRCFDENLPEKHDIITDLIDTSPGTDAHYDLLTADDVEKLEEIARNEHRDAVWEKFKELANTLLSPRWDSYVDREAYDKLVNGSGSRRRLSVFSLLRPDIFEGFRSVTLAGACFKDSLLYRHWSKLGVGFVPAANHNLRYEQHENADELTILWAIEQNWSKWLMRQGEGQVLKMMKEAVLREFGDANFLYAQNKGHDLFRGIENAHCLPNAPHGLNSFQHIRDVAFLPARNLSPAHCKFLQRMMGLTEDDIRTAIHRQVAYQTVMRGALRDPENHEEKRIFIPDLGTAEWLRSLFPEAKLRKVETDFEKLDLPTKRGRKRVYGSDAERKRASRERKKWEERIKEINDLRNPVAPTEAALEDVKHLLTGHDISIYSNSNFVTEMMTKFRVSSFKDKFSKTPSACFVTDTIGDFEGILKEAFQERYAKKEDNFLISPSVFVHKDNIKEERGLENVVFSSGIWLDFDGGDLRPSRLSKIFPQLRMTVYSSFNSTKASLRFRVYIPTDRAMTAQQYKVITGELVKAIIAEGFYKERSNGQSNRHGLDTGKLNASDILYFPCQPKDPSGAYFKVFKGKGREPLLVLEWIEKYIAEEEAVSKIEDASTFIETPLQETEPLSPDQQAIERACWEWQQCPPGKGNREFFKLGSRLVGAECDQSEITSILHDQARYAHSPNERLKQIPSILSSLQNYWKIGEAA